AEVTWREFNLFALKYLATAHKNNPTNEARFSVADAMANPTAPYNIGSISYNKAGKSDTEYPASGMTHYAAQVYCKWLTSITGRYYRLPTEAEWEFACRAGADTAFFFGDDASVIDDYAWTKNNCESGTGYEKIKQKKPNAYGLYDISGNVAEWTCEKYNEDAYQQRADGKAPQGPFVPTRLKPDGFGVVARGGSCDDVPADCRSAKRIVSVEAWKEQDPQYPKSIWWMTDAPFVGLRVVRPLNPPKTEAEFKKYDPDPNVWVKYSNLNNRT
ncbi:MAG: formylglycine-generating enzyme family protein, partial [Thermoguttaceae bacterium]